MIRPGPGLDRISMSTRICRSPGIPFSNPFLFLIPRRERRAERRTRYARRLTGSSNAARCLLRASPWFTGSAMAYRRLSQRKAFLHNRRVVCLFSLYLVSPEPEPSRLSSYPSHTHPLRLFCFARINSFCGMYEGVTSSRGSTRHFLGIALG